MKPSEICGKYGINRDQLLQIRRGLQNAEKILVRDEKDFELVQDAAKMLDMDVVEVVTNRGQHVAVLTRWKSDDYLKLNPKELEQTKEMYGFCHWSVM